MELTTRIENYTIVNSSGRFVIGLPTVVAKLLVTGVADQFTVSIKADEELDNFIREWITKKVQELNESPKE